jgi:hypothetical protein
LIRIAERSTEPENRAYGFHAGRHSSTNDGKLALAGRRSVATRNYDQVAIEVTASIAIDRGLLCFLRFHRSAKGNKRKNK